jgi:hypothetical protein
VDAGDVSSHNGERSIQHMHTASPSPALTGLRVRAPCLNRLDSGPGCLRWLRPGLSAGVLP